MHSVLHTVEEVNNRISKGERLLLAGDETALRQLPAGAWIGGTIPYFISETGGVCSRNLIYVTELPDFIVSATIKVYDESTLASVYQDIPENGFGFIILPGMSKIHEKFALLAPSYRNFAVHPLVGWVSGVYLDDVGVATPKAFDGTTLQASESRAVVMHVQLPQSKAAKINIVNIFKQGGGDEIVFDNDGFTVTDARINGEVRNFADYVDTAGLDTTLPLVADYFGTRINVSLQAVNAEKRQVTFYAPVFSGLKYYHAAPVENYVTEFEKCINSGGESILFSCNCILNYFYSQLETKHISWSTGPVTFGEIASQLLNQTTVDLSIIECNSKSSDNG